MPNKTEIILPSALNGIVVSPPSKSSTHRAIICASLAEGKSKISNYLDSEDIEETIGALRGMDAKIEKKASNGVLEITGTENFTGKNSCAERAGKTECQIECISYSGSTLRFLIPIAALVKTAKQEPIVFVIQGRLKERPIKPLIEALKKLGVKCSVDNALDGEEQYIIINPGIKGGKTDIEGNVSSQFITGLLLACPRAKKDTEITITTELESKNYVDLTLDILKDFGIKVEASEDLRKFKIPGNQHYKAREFKVEGDYSSAAFFLAAGAINGDVKVEGLSINSKQGDKEILNILKRMGAKIIAEDDGIHIKTSKLKGTAIDGKNIPDLIPICAVLCCFAEGESIINNAERLRIKESNRLAAITQELKKMGADIKESEDGLIIRGKCKLKGAKINPHNDHRIAMACAVAALSAKGETTINHADCVNKSYPNFFKDLYALKSSENNICTAPIKKPNI